MSNTLKLGNGKWATGKDNLLAYNDENNNFKPLPFSFSRGTTATVVNEQGLIELVGSDEPRIDFKDNTKGSLLLEPTRSNSFLQSNQFDTTWTLFNAVRTPNQIGVGNSTDAWKITDNTTNNRHSIIQNTNTGGIISLSIYAKANSVNFIYLRGVTNNANKYTWFNLANGTVGVNQGISAEIVPMGNGWYRCTMTLDHQSGFENYIGISNEDGVSTYQGDGFGSAFIQYSQSEIGSYATSYIPTNGSAATRVEDSTSQTVSDSVIGQTEGTMFVDCKINAQGTYTGFSLSDGTTNNEVIVRFTTTDRIEYYLRSGGSQPFGGGTTAFDTDSIVKVALAYKSGYSVFYVNGTEVASSTNTTIPLNLSKVKFSRGNSTAVFSGKTNNFKIYNTRLSNSELAALTTI